MPADDACMRETTRSDGRVGAQGAERDRGFHEIRSLCGERHGDAGAHPEQPITTTGSPITCSMKLAHQSG